MKRALPLLLVPTLLLAACGSSKDVSLQDNLQNPLYALRYYEDLSEQMVTMEISNDPILKDAAKKNAVDAGRKNATEKAQAAVNLKETGLQGTIQSDKDMAVGNLDLIKNMLYFGVDFSAMPTPSLHVFISSAVDPRQGTFPDKTAVDLGSIKSAYGAQAFTVPGPQNGQTYRSVALYDTSLGMVTAFAQLAGH